MQVIFGGLVLQNINVLSATNFTGDRNEKMCDWSRADESCLQLYQANLNSLLCSISIPIIDNNQDVCKTIDNYYQSIKACIKSSSNNSIPMHGAQFNNVVPGWNDYVKDKHAAARSAFLQWVYVGKPRVGLEYVLMVRTRSAFKLALRQCRRNEEVLRADKYAVQLSNNDHRAFWSNVNQKNNAKSTSFSHTVGGCCGADKITNMWQEHFSKLYNCIQDNDTRTMLYQRLNDTDTEAFFITVQDVQDALNKQKLQKSVGTDGISMEALVFGGNRLAVHICSLFNLFLKYSYLPKSFMHSKIIPLVKCKSGDLTDINNYRAIAISTCFSKLFEHCLITPLYSFNTCDYHQFGFKSAHSTALCTNTFKQTVNYYINNGSHVFACFIDFSKAFDKVNYWKLFNMLLDDNISKNIVKVLAFWYSVQEVCVRWQTNTSENFTIGNGTRQGGVLSPFLFSRYIRNILSDIEFSRIGCNIGGTFINILAYADDIVLLAPSHKALQHLLDILCINIASLDLTCNTNKTMCMIFNPVNRSKIVTNSFPHFFIGNCKLQFCTSFKYLGHIINNDLSDDLDIQREVRNLYIRTNMLIRRFSKCSLSVKRLLFKTFCLCFYDTALWSNYHKKSINKFTACYNKCLKKFFGYKRQDSLTMTLFELKLPSCDTTIFNNNVLFRQQCLNSVNSIVACICNVCYA